MKIPDRILPATTTPPVITDRLLAFAAELSPLPLAYVTGIKTGYPMGQCHTNVKRHVAHHGGGIVFGWTLWEAADHIEAEFHAMWLRSPDALVDVTTTLDGASRVLFVEDLVRRFDFITERTWSNRIVMNDG